MVNQGLHATSKSSLKLQCLFCAKGDLKEAKELYEFFASDMPNLPDNDPTPPTWVDSTKNTLSGIVQWANENPNAVSGIYDFVRSLTGNRLPEIPRQAIDTPLVENHLPPINE